MKNLKKFLALLLALCMLTGMLGTAAFAAETEEVTSDGIYDSDSFVAAMAAGGSYKLTADFTLTSYVAEIPIGKTVVLDMNGYTLTVTDSIIYPFKLAGNTTGGSELTIMGTGAVNAKASIFSVSNNATLNVEGDVIFTTTGQFAGMAGTVNIKGGTFNGQNMYVAGTANIKGGTFNLTGHRSQATFNGRGAVNISGGEFTLAQSQNGVLVDNSANVNITGGKFTAAEGTDLTALNDCVAEGYEISASGDVVEAGSEPVYVIEADGKQYTTEEIKTLLESGNGLTGLTSVKLLADLDWNASFGQVPMAVNASGVTIDLNQKTMTTGYTSGGDPLLVLLGDFTLKNGKVQANGSYGIFTGNVPPQNEGVAKIENVEVLGGGINAGSAVELTNVTATGNTYYAVWSESSGVVIKSGNYSSDGYAVLGISSQHGSMTVEGGTFTAEGTTPMVLGGTAGKPLIKGGTFNKDMSTENATLDESLQWKDNGNGNWTVEEKKPEPEPEEKDVKIERNDASASFATLQEAINAFTNEDYDNYYTIVYNKPWTESVTIKKGQKVTISLDHTLTNEAGQDTITVEDGGWLTLYFNNDKVELVNNSASCAAIKNAGIVHLPYNAKVKGDYVLKNTGGTVRLDGGRYDGQIEATAPVEGAETVEVGSGYMRNIPKGTVSVGNGVMAKDPDENIVIKQDSDRWCITSEEGWYRCTQPQAEMNGQNYATIQDAVAVAGTTPSEIKVVYPFSSVSSVAITVAEGQNITLDLNGKTLSSKSNTKADPSIEPVIVNNGTLTIKGKGTVKPGNTSGKFTANTVENTGALTIEGGTYQAYTGYKSLINDGGTVTVKGGKFAEDISEIATPGEGLQFTADGKGVEEKLDETNAAAKIVDGETTTYYKTLQDAIKAAAAGDTVTLVNDVDLTGLPTGYNVFDISGMTLNLNEKTITSKNNENTFAVFQGKNARITNGVFEVSGGAYALFVGDEGETDNFIIEDVTTAGVNIYNATNVTLRNVISTGRANSSGQAYYAVWCDQNAHVTIESGTYGVGDNSPALIALSKTEAEMKIENGTFASGSFPIVLSGDYGKPVISGGTFDKDVSEYCVEGYRATQNSDGTYGVAAIPTVPTTYRIQVTAGDGGSASASRRSAARGATVTVTVTPDEGYELSEITAVTAAGRNVTLSGSDGSYTFTMPSAVVTVTVTFAEAENLEDPDTPLAGAMPFEDVTRNDWYFGAISSVYLKELMVGISGTEFGPEMPSNRGTVATILHRMENTPDAEMGDFTDVLAGQWYAPAISWANQAGVMIGYDTGVFQPEGGITREQLALTFYRYYTKVKGGTAETRADLSTFADAEQVSGWAREAMEWAVGCGLLKGTTENCLAPQGATKRSELAAVLERFLELK